MSVDRFEDVETARGTADAQRSRELAALLERIATGDQQAFEAFYDATSSSVYGVARAVLRDPDHASEVTQEVYLEVWRSADKFASERGSARGWLHTLTHRRSVDRVRSVQSQRNRDAAHELHETPFDEVSESVLGGIDAKRVRTCLETLTDLQRKAIVSAFFGGLSYPEVANESGTPLPTVKSRIRDGMLRLKNCLGGER